ncbi:MAG: molybdopyranopterin monophosphate insertase [Candidatus Cloacimonetes bacterium HGW-Cloacimonetes-1]|jgi:xanthine dehydrogenase accessory factor|nr:MAG: molybdopyranopterin monophosphate insertase [Candidatus Cloacimonetes bacterium HGW-Cloacimonetes-1]
MDYTKYYEKLKQYMALDLRMWQVTIVATDGSTPAKPGMKMIIPLDHPEYGNLGGGEMEHELIKHVRESQPQGTEMLAFKLNNKGIFSEVKIDENVDVSTNMICGGSVEVFIEALFKKDRLFIIGAGHCGKALSHLAKLCGFYVALIDNRESQLTKETSLYSDRMMLSNYMDIGEVVEFDDSAYIVIMTHGHVHDKQVLEQCLKHKYKYLGMIGSKTKVAETFERVMANGFSREDIASVHAPVGLAIGSQTPYEIAVSICGELIQIRNAKKLSVSTESKANGSPACQI